MNDFAEPGASGKAYRVKIKQFADFLDRGLNLDPARRMTPEEALQHDFINKNMKDIMASEVD